MSLQCSDEEQGLGVRVLVLGDSDGVIDVSVLGVTATATITIPGGGIYFFEAILTDSDTDSTETKKLPSSIETRFKGTTDSSGVAVINIVNSNSAQTYFLFITLLKANVSASFTVGV